jgi:hypothetical protein
MESFSVRALVRREKTKAAAVTATTITATARPTQSQALKPVGATAEDDAAAGAAAEGTSLAAPGCAAEGEEPVGGAPVGVSVMTVPEWRSGRTRSRGRIRGRAGVVRDGDRTGASGGVEFALEPFYVTAQIGGGLVAQLTVFFEGFTDETQDTGENEKTPKASEEQIAQSLEGNWQPDFNNG